MTAPLEGVFELVGQFRAAPTLFVYPIFALTQITQEQCCPLVLIPLLFATTGLEGIFCNSERCGESTYFGSFNDGSILNTRGVIFSALTGAGTSQITRAIVMRRYLKTNLMIRF